MHWIKGYAAGITSINILCLRSSINYFPMSSNFISLFQTVSPWPVKFCLTFRKFTRDSALGPCRWDVFTWSNTEYSYSVSVWLDYLIWCPFSSSWVNIDVVTRIVQFWNKQTWKESLKNRCCWLNSALETRTIRILFKVHDQETSKIILYSLVLINMTNICKSAFYAFAYR